ncbi:hypothetical protein PM082_012374 [Marasmius tenuissimus]|nr:hypothetical protein PM082_012374 [Marasmius tenuissimus]
MALGLVACASAGHPRPWQAVAVCVSRIHAVYMRLHSSIMVVPGCRPIERVCLVLIAIDVCSSGPLTRKKLLLGSHSRDES